MSVLSFSFICWFHSLGVKNRNSLQRIVRIASKITAVPQRDLALFCEQQILRKARSILTKKDYILNQIFAALPSDRRLRCPICKTNRFKNSFMPVAVRLLNNTNCPLWDEAGFIFRSVKAGPLQVFAGGSPRKQAGSPAESTKQCSSSCPWQTRPRPRKAFAQIPPLVANPSSD